MTNVKGTPEGAPPAYGSQVNSPEHLDAGPASSTSDSPYPPPQAHIANQGGGGGYPPYNKPQGISQGGYSQPGPMQYGPPQGGYYGQQQQQQGYYGGGYYGQPQQQGYYGGGYGPYGRPQGHYMDDPRAGSAGFGEALLASLACCCCLDACLLF